jgi:ABC-type nitrate/sulfonate/bicarbonate transport system ATPase subunit
MIEIQQLSKIFPANGDNAATRALCDVSLSIKENEFVALLGPSGCGKTTLLRLLAGLMRPTSGRILIRGREVTGPGSERAMVFQHFAVLPWATVFDNVAFGLEVQQVSRAERQEIVRKLIKQVGLEGFEKHMPGQLSGGMQQRVGLARALAVDPQILLMDEPFGALDAQTRRIMQEDLLRLLDHKPKSVLFVTHSMAEAVRLADRVVVLSPRPGRIHDIIDIPFGRPRPSDFDRDPLFRDLEEYLWDMLRSMQRTPQES